MKANTSYKLLSTFLTAGIALILSACSFSLAEDIAPPPGSELRPDTQAQAGPISGPLYPLVAPNPVAGAPIFAEKCAPCHGASGQGDGPQSSQLPNPPSAIGSAEVARQASPVDWYQIVTEGNLERFMPPFSTLSDRQRWDVLAYTYSLSAPAEAVEGGQELYQANCAGCHGEGGRGDGPQATGLTSILPDFSDQAFMAEKSAAELYDAMLSLTAHATLDLAGQVDDDQLWSLAAYLRSFTFSSTGKVVLATPSQEEIALPEVEATSVTTATLTYGVVKGQVINGSGGDLSGDLQVTLHGFDEMQVVISATTTSQADGTFIFQDVEMPEGRVFLATTELGQATYGSDIAVAQAGSNELSLQITAYETTSDASILEIDRLHMFFDFETPAVVRVIELYILNNPGDKTVMAAGQGQAVTRFFLPEGASNLQFQEGALGERYIKTEDGFADTLAVRPSQGEYQVLFAFDMPYNRKLDLVQPVSLPVNAVVVLMPEGGVKVKSDMLKDDGSRPVEGFSYHMYSGGKVEAGGQLSLTLSGRPGSDVSLLNDPVSRNNLVIGLGAFGVVLVGAGFLLYRRSQTGERKNQGSDGDLDDLEGGPQASISVDQDEASLMDAIIALDDLYRQGDLPEEAYQRRRAELKGRLRELLEGDDRG